LARAVSWKRLLPLVVVACAAAAALVSVASAGGIRDWEPCPDGGNGLLVCPQGTTGAPYSIKFRAVEEPPCQPGEDVWVIDNGSPPPGLSLATDGTLSGTPTQAGTFNFWVEMQLPDNDHCNGTADTTQEQFSITILPGVPRLVIGPEQSGVPVGTVSTPYSLQMTATVPDSKTWSIADGALPAGVTLVSTNGLISGTPTTAGTYAFTVRAEIDPQRVDTKTLAITVRDRVAIGTAVTPPSEVGVPFLMPLTATGGTGTFAWSVSSGAMPTGLGLTPTGAIVGKPAEAGRFAFTVTATDAEGRTGAHPTTLTVAERLAVVAQRLRPARQGRFYQVRLKTTGGVQPAIWRIKRGPLPRGMRFDRQLGLLYGTPTRARTYRMQFEAQDALRVRSAGTVTLVVKAAPKPSKSKIRSKKRR
jgi:large repetitive protein